MAAMELHNIILTVKRIPLDAYSKKYPFKDNVTKLAAITYEITSVY
jgi:hypothetical protein